MMNLIVNAFDAIEVKGGAKGRIVVGCEVQDDNIVITVKDNGWGMSDETKNRLFEPFYTTKEVGTGTGLGLSIAYGIVKKHGGELSVESKLGEGALVKLTLPMST